MALSNDQLKAILAELTQAIIAAAPADLEAELALIDSFLSEKAVEGITNEKELQNAYWLLLVDDDLESTIQAYHDARKHLSKSFQKQLKKKYTTLKKKKDKKGKQPKKEGSKKKETDLDPSQYRLLRKEQIENFEKAGGNAYPHKFNVTWMSNQIPKFIEKYETTIEAGEHLEDEVKIAGRIMLKREAGKKLIFYTIEGDGANIQIMSSLNNYKGTKDEFLAIHDLLHRGDIVGITGHPCKSKKGELSISPTKLELLSTCYHQLPKSMSGTLDSELRYRQRYMDLILNKRSRDTFVARSRIIQTMRRYLDNLGFLEVETPQLNVQAGGAAARPFKTYHNDLKRDFFLRIAPELYLKMLVVGGLDRVYEIGKNFRNEGIDLTHNPEFTACEFYWAYADHQDLIETTEDMLCQIVQSVCGKQEIVVHPDATNRDVKMEVSFKRPFKRINMIQELETQLNVTFPRPLESEACNTFLIELFKKLEIEMEPPLTTNRLLDELVGEYIEPKCISPTFLIGHPKLMSPLAKGDRNDPNITERFELMICGKEVCNAYTELNSPWVQRERFDEQARDREQGDAEACEKDETFCTSLEYALPPTAGWGLGIDRLCMMLTDNYNIKDVILFPAMKPKDQ